MSVGTARKDELFIAVGTAVALHGIAFVLLVALALAEILIESDKDEPTPKVPPAAFIEISPDYFTAAASAPAPPVVPPPAAPVEPPEPDLKKRAVTTAPHQESDEAPEGAAFIGERNTKAASDIAPDPNATKQPAIAGEEPDVPEMTRTFDSKFNEGEEPGEKATPVAPAEPLAGDPVEASLTEEQPKPEEMKKEESGRPKESVIDSPDQVEVPVEEGKREKMEEALPKEKPSESESKPAKKGEGGTAETPPQARPKKSGFQTESKKTRMRGAVSRRGQASLEVEDTPVGRYYGKVTRALENEWQKQCMQRRDHLLPGILTLRFIVNEHGSVNHMRFLDQVGASEIQKGITLNSVRYANIPAMPKDVAKELDGEPLELIIRFHY